MQYFLSPGLKSDILGGNYLSHRQQPPASTHILRTLRGYAEASACAVTQLLLYICKQALSSVFSHIFQIFSIFFLLRIQKNYFAHQTGCFRFFRCHLSGCFLQKIINLYFLFYNFSSSFSIHRSGCFKKYFSKHIFYICKICCGTRCICSNISEKQLLGLALKNSRCFRHRLLLFIFLLRIRFI